jgi:hypothetical protein
MKSKILETVNFKLKKLHNCKKFFQSTDCYCKFEPLRAIRNLLTKHL